MLRQSVDRLNQWIPTQPPPAGWKLDPMLSKLSKPMADLPQIKNLDRLEFSSFDGFALQEAVWLRDIARWAKGDVIDDLERTKNIFDWTVRNVQIEYESPNWIPRFPWETLWFGRGTAAERAWVFILLLRQLDIDAAVLLIEEGQEATGAERSEKAETKQGAGTKKGTETKKEKGENPQGKNAPESQPAVEKKKTAKTLRSWCVGVLIDGNVYLFDPLLGLPIPAPQGVSLAADGQLAVQPATLAQVAADDQLLRRLDADATHAYGVKASQLARVTAMFEASPPYLARRMTMLESQLTGAKNGFNRFAVVAGPTVEGGQAHSRCAAVAVALSNPPNPQPSHSASGACVAEGLAPHVYDL